MSITIIPKACQHYSKYNNAHIRNINDYEAATLADTVRQAGQHAIILLTGPARSGKTTIARGIGHKLDATNVAHVITVDSVEELRYYIKDYYYILRGKPHDGLLKRHTVLIIDSLKAFDLTDLEENKETLFNSVPDTDRLTVIICQKHTEQRRLRGFELVSTESKMDLLPKRETAHSAAYDLKVSRETIVEPGQTVLVPLGVKAYMQPGEVLYLYDRSSNPKKLGLVLRNSVGVIDGDYYNNPSNEGLIMAQMHNITDQPVTLEVGQRIVQAVFAPFLVADGDTASGERTGGFGSTGA